MSIEIATEQWHETCENRLTLCRDHETDKIYISCIECGIAWPTHIEQQQLDGITDIPAKFHAKRTYQH